MSSDVDTGSPVSDPVELTAHDDLNRTIEQHAVVLVDFYADWCEPCQQMEPTLDALASETNTLVVKVDVDQFQSLAAEHGVRGVPTLLIYVDGKLAEQLVGAQTKAALLRTIENAQR